jgi:anti-sigma regulatory factor (Ser/Thr protein kinase)
MATRAQEIRNFILEKISNHPKNIVAITAEAFDVTRMTVHRHLNRLLGDKKIVKTGTTKGASYFLKTSLDKTLIFQIQSETQTGQVWEEYMKNSFSRLSDSVLEICRYGFEEIFNNALLHSGGKGIVVKTVWKKDSLELAIIDDGKGIFQSIQQALGLQDIREGVLQLTKGNFTTLPERHSGQGLFLVSRLFDVFGLFSDGLFYCKDNLGDDWYLEKSKTSISKGTRVSMAIRFDCERTLKQVVGRYSSKASESPAMDKTEILIMLSQMEDEPYISRQQAKRVLLGAGKYRRVVLDFQNIPTVGQAFVDEVFREFRSSHPEVDIESVHANPDVQFMIDKSLSPKTDQVPLS